MTGIKYLFVGIQDVVNLCFAGIATQTVHSKHDDHTIRFVLKQTFHIITCIVVIGMNTDLGKIFV